MKETEVAEKVIEYMAADGWEIFKEVYEPYNPYRRIDIVCKKGNILWAIECKSNINFKVLWQARRSNTYCHFSSVAVPKIKDTDILGYVKNHCELNKFGLFLIEQYSVSVSVWPKLYRNCIADHMFPHLHQVYKSVEIKAGSKDSFWSPYKQTIMNVVKILKEHKKLTKDELFDKLDGKYHWTGKSAKNTMAAQILKFEKDIITTEKSGKLLYFKLK